jgi:hypothetical protein
MRFAGALACFVCRAEGFAQSNASLDAIRYPPIAAAARIQGDVLISGGNAVTGSPLLRETALRGIDVLNFRAPQSDVLVHFILVETIQSTRTEAIKRGDAFDQFFLRLLGVPTVKKIEIRVCTEGPHAPANRIDSTRDPIEVWVYGNTPCIETNASYTGTLARS